MSVSLSFSLSYCVVLSLQTHGSDDHTRADTIHYTGRVPRRAQSFLLLFEETISIRRRHDELYMCTAASGGYALIYDARQITFAGFCVHVPQVSSVDVALLPPPPTHNSEYNDVFRFGMGAQCILH